MTLNNLKLLVLLLQTVGGNGVGCVAVHPSKTLFAVCEKGNGPNVYIYNYPDLTIFKVY